MWGTWWRVLLWIVITWLSEWLESWHLWMIIRWLGECLKTDNGWIQRHMLFMTVHSYKWSTHGRKEWEERRKSCMTTRDYDTRCFYHYLYDNADNMESHSRWIFLIWNESWCQPDCIWDKENLTKCIHICNHWYHFKWKYTDIIYGNRLITFIGSIQRQYTGNWLYTETVYGASTTFIH